MELRLVALFVVLSVAACGSRAQPDAGIAGEPRARETADAGRERGSRDTTPPNCDELDRRGCMEAAGCTLVIENQPSHQYLCREVQPPCETLVRQSELSNPPGSGNSMADVRAAQKRCNDADGCVYDPGGCYCDCKGYGRTKIPDKSGPDCNCVCSGGPPPICREGSPDTVDR